MAATGLRAASMIECIFCEMAAGRFDDPDLTVFEDQQVFARISLHQKAGNQGHVLVIPKKHIRNIYELSPDLDAALMSALRRLARAVKQAFSAEGILIRQTNEAAAGQDVFHLHFHVIPRYRNDSFETKKYEELSLKRRKEIAEQLTPAVQAERAS